MAKANLCQLCFSKSASYTCPRCNVPYCSLECYKSEKHLTCSEVFYKDCVLDELQNTRAHDEKQHMLQILQKVFEEEEVEGYNLEERMRGLDLDNDTEQIWNQLTEVERQEFVKLAEAGEIKMEVSEPWWIIPAVQEIGAELDHKKPKLLTNIPDLSSLWGNKTPGCDILYDLVSVMFAYVCEMRFRNCDVHADTVGACSEMLELSASLEKASVSSTEEAIQFGLRAARAKSGSLELPEESLITALNDVCTIFEGSGRKLQSDNLVLALSALIDLFKTARNDIIIIKKTDLKSQSKQFYVVKKRLQFFLSYVKDYYSPTNAQAVIDTVRAESLRFQAEQQSHKSAEERIVSEWDKLGCRHGQQENPPSRSNLVEELN